MIRPELFKLRHHRTPWVLAAIHAVAVLAVPTWLAFRPPSDPAVYLEGVWAVYNIVGAMLGAVFGAWLFGHEYRHGTLRRLVAIDARRRRLLATKAAVGLAALIGGLAAVAAVGTGAAMAVAGLNDHSLVLDDLVRTVAAAGLPAVVAAALAFVLSVILRSNTYALLGSLATMTFLGPLLALIPRIGRFTPFAATEVLAGWINRFPAPDGTSVTAAALTLLAFLGVGALAATELFNRRDI